MFARQAEVPNEAVASVEAALALEMSEKDGSIVLSAGSMFVTAEVMAVWKERESEIVAISQPKSWIPKQ